ncbi:MAG TPA: hypothetical protein VGI45_20270 [Terracidiphilus sp.]
MNKISARANSKDRHQHCSREASVMQVLSTAGPEIFDDPEVEDAEDAGSEEGEPPALFRPILRWIEESE